MMTNKEAIKRIKEHIAIHKYRESHAIHIVEALNRAISALEKQIPMKTLDPEPGTSPRRPVIIRCGNCGKQLAYSMQEYCPRCGQAIDWEEE